MRTIRLRDSFITAAVCLISFLPLAAQQNLPVRTFLHGTVRDAVTHQPLMHVVVMIEAETSGYAGQAETDTSGNFNIQGIAQDVFVVRVRLPGYEEASERVDLTVPSSNYVNFELRPKPGNAPPAIAPEGPGSRIDARLATIPAEARKEFIAARDAWEKGRDPQTCIDRLNKATRIYPDFADAYVLLGTVEIQKNDAADATRALQRALQIAPQMPEAWFTLGMLQNREKDYADAEKNLVHGLQLDEASSQGHYELAKTYWITGRWQEAEPHAQKAATLQPPIPPAHVLLGNIALHKNDASGALKEFQEYLKLDPKGSMAEGTRAMIKKLQTAPKPPK